MAVRPPGSAREPTPGYYLGGPPRFGGQGSGMGPKSNTPGGNNRLNFSAADWHPTVVNLLVLLVVEIVLYGTLRWAFRSFHGG